MTKVEEIEKEIEDLPIEEFEKLRAWFSKKDWDKWDQEIKADSDTGKLEFLVKEAKNSKYGEEHREL
jgi:hypothetical protein